MALAAPHADLRFLGTLSASRDAARLWENSRLLAAPAAGEAALGASYAPRAAGSGTAPAVPGLGRPAAGASAGGRSLVPRLYLEAPVLIPRQGWLRDIRDRAGYAAILASSVRWRLTTHLAKQWELFKQSRQNTPGEPSVKRLPAFYAEHLVMGSVGRMGPFGLRAAENGVVVQDSWYLFNKYFEPDAETTASFAGFVARVQRYNPNRRITQFRKMLFTALEKAALLPKEQLPAFFDRLADPREAERLAEYQRTRQAEDLAIFSKAVDDTVRELNVGQPAGQRIVGVVLMGSFANGAAGPESDLDAQAIAENGSPVHIERFFQRLEERWVAAGEGHHELGNYQYALPLSKGLVSRLHREHYLVFSPYPEVLQLMQRSAAEDAAQLPSQVRKLPGRVFNLLYVGTVAAFLAAYELWRLLKKAAG